MYMYRRKGRIDATIHSTDPPSPSYTEWGNYFRVKWVLGSWSPALTSHNRESRSVALCVSCGLAEYKIMGIGVLQKYA